MERPTPARRPGPGRGRAEAHSRRRHLLLRRCRAGSEPDRPRSHRRVSPDDHAESVWWGGGSVHAWFPPPGLEAARPADARHRRRHPALRAPPELIRPCRRCTPMVRERPIAEQSAELRSNRQAAERRPNGVSPPQKVVATPAWVLAYALLLGLCGCVYISPHTLRGACSNDLDSPIRNFCVVTPGTLWRGPNPNAADAHWLLERGVRSIVSLQRNDKRAFEDAAAPPHLSQSLPYFQVPGFSPLQVLSAKHLDDHVALFLAIMKQAPKPIYIHCRAGVDRTGVVAAAYQVMIE